MEQRKQQPKQAPSEHCQQCEEQPDSRTTSMSWCIVDGNCVKVHDSTAQRKTTIIYKSKPHQNHNITSIQPIHSKTKATMCIPTIGRRINISIHDSDSSRPPLSFSRIVTVRHNRCGPPWHRLPPCIVEGQRVISRHRAAETQMKNRTFRRIEWKANWNTNI